MWNKKENIKRSLLSIIVLIASIFIIVKYNINSKYKDDFYLTNQYIITFETDSEIKLESLALVTNEQINLPTLERNNYTFLGWVDEKGNEITNPYTVKKDEVIKAKWSLNNYKSYTVSYNLNGGDGTYASSSVKEGTSVSKPKDPTRTGYIFKGWYLNNKAYDFNNKVNNDITLVAKWEVNENHKFTVAFIYNDGKGKIEKYNVKAGKKVTEPKNPTRVGYTFGGWYLNGEKYNFNKSVNEDLNLVAYWIKGDSKTEQYIVTFDLNGGVGSVETQFVVAAGKVKEPNSPVRKGYSFLGWYYGSNKYNFNSKVSKDMILVAKWSKDSSSTKYYKVTFETNTTESKVASQSVAEGKKVAKPTTPKKKGYKFKGWYLDGSKYDFNTKVKKNITLKAVWQKYDDTKLYTVRFDSNGGKESFAKQTVQEGKTVKSPTKPTRSGYKFKGWYNGNTKYNFNSPVTKSITLVALWDKEVVKYKVSFDLKGGTGNINEQKVIEGQTVKKPSNPKRSGYTFEGWYKGSSKYNFTSPVKGNFTLTASWKKQEEAVTYYVVTYNLNGGSGSIKSEVIANGSTATRPSNPTRSGYTFNNWYYNGSVFNFNTRITSNITLVANWTKKSTGGTGGGGGSTGGGSTGGGSQNPNTCTPTPSKSNVKSSGVQTHCLTQTCVNGVWNVVSNSSSNSIRCASGYEKKYYLQSTTCNMSGTHCSASSKSNCTQKWYYSCEPIHTIINVPIDSRPITRLYMEFFARSVGMDYKEVSSGLDSSYGTWGYSKGNYSSVVNATRNLVSSNNNKNTTVILNTTSYSFGGLTSSRGYNAYTNLDSKISSLRSLLTTYRNPRYYVTFIIPRTRPENRVMSEFAVSSTDQATGPANYKGLKCFESGSNSNCKETLVEVTMQWGYLDSMKRHNSSAYNKTPNYVKEFYNYFTSTYINDTNSGPYKYKKTFELANEYLSELFRLKSNGYIDDLIIGNDDFELPYYILYDSRPSWAPKDSSGNFIKYSLAYDVYSNYASRESSTVNFFGTDETNSLIFAREAIRVNGKRVRFSYDLLNGMDKIQNYDRMSASETVRKFINFVNYYGGSYYSKPMQIQFISGSSSSNNITNSTANSIYNVVDNSSKNILALEADGSGFNPTMRNYLVNKGGRSIFEIPAISGWNTFANAAGIGIARAVSYTIVDDELSRYAFSTEYKDRLENLTKSQMVAVLEDSIYNNYNRDAYASPSPNISSLKSEGTSLLNTELNGGVRLSIGKYYYQVNGASFNAVSPWNRRFEPEIIPRISGITVSEK